MKVVDLDMLDEKQFTLVQKVLALKKGSAFVLEAKTP